MVNLTINGKKISVPENTTILKAAASAGIEIPTLCHLEGINEIGACRLCVVEVEGYERLFTSCNNPVEEGMVVHTNSKKVRESRLANLHFILSEHRDDCTSCHRSGNCELQALAQKFNIHTQRFGKHYNRSSTDPTFPLIRDNSKCVKCMRCVQVCDNIQNSHVWDVINTGSDIAVNIADAYKMQDANCVLCGQCITHCPTGALQARDDLQVVLDAIDDPEKIVIAQIAPAIRTAWGEEFGMKPEDATVECLGSSLRLAGCDYVFDTTFSADLTIMEEGSELIEHLKHRDEHRFPMFTSCCPAWVRYVKSHWPGFVDNLSSAKSPQQMFGAITKTYYAQILGVDPAKIFCFSVMPCLAKKAECALPGMDSTGTGPDVDASLTTREAARLVRWMCIDPSRIEVEPLDTPLGTGSGAGAIFGATGGVMEAALRSAAFLLTGKNPPADAFKNVRGMKGWKEASYELPGITLKVAIAHGLANADALLMALDRGEVHYDFVEIMSCPGGCVGGGGQPIHPGHEMAEYRAPVLYSLDKNMDLRFSHENPAVQECYKNFLGAPLSEKSHHLLHTGYHNWQMPAERKNNSEH